MNSILGVVTTLALLGTPAALTQQQLVKNLVFEKCRAEFGKVKAAEKAAYYAPLITRAARRHQLDPKLVASVVWFESNYHPECVSPVGARGLMQVMPCHFRRGEAWSDPQTNLNVGCRVLRGYLHRAGGNVSWALMMYNAGPGGASRGWGRRYANAVVRTAR